MIFITQDREADGFCMEDNDLREKPSLLHRLCNGKWFTETVIDQHNAEIDSVYNKSTCMGSVPSCLTIQGC